MDVANALARLFPSRFTFGESATAFGYVEQRPANVFDEYRQANVLQNASVLYILFYKV